MKVVDLIEQLQRYPDDYEVRIAAFGGMRMGKDIDHVATGFDLDHDAAIIQPIVPLQIKPESRSRPRPALAPNDRPPKPRRLEGSRKAKEVL